MISNVFFWVGCAILWIALVLAILNYVSHMAKKHYQSTETVNQFVGLTFLVLIGLTLVGIGSVL